MKVNIMNLLISLIIALAAMFIYMGLSDIPVREKKEKPMIYINRHDLGIRTVVTDSIEDVIFCTNKYMTKDEFIKEYIEK